MSNKQTDTDIIPPSPKREENLVKGVDEMMSDPDDVPGGTSPGGLPRPDLEGADTEDIQKGNIPEDTNIPHTPSSEDTIALKSPAVQGEEDLGGSNPDPTKSYGDTLKDAHKVGEQQKEDLEHPKELNISRDVNSSEENIRES